MSYPTERRAGCGTFAFLIFVAVVFLGVLWTGIHHGDQARALQECQTERTRLIHPADCPVTSGNGSYGNPWLLGVITDDHWFELRQGVSSPGARNCDWSFEPEELLLCYWQETVGTDTGTAVCREFWMP